MTFKFLQQEYIIFFTD